MGEGEVKRDGESVRKGEKKAEGVERERNERREEVRFRGGSEKDELTYGREDSKRGMV